MDEKLSAEYIASVVAYRLNHYQATLEIAIRTYAGPSDTTVLVTATHDDGTVQRFEVQVSER